MVRIELKNEKDMRSFIRIQEKLSDERGHEVTDNEVILYLMEQLDQGKTESTLHVFATTENVTCKSHDQDKTITTFITNLEKAGWIYQPKVD